MSSFLFVDSRVQDSDLLLAGLGEDVQVVLLEAGSDGVEQIVRALSGVGHLDAIHIVSHGSSGTLYLGSTVLTAANLDDYQSALSQIGASLSEDGDLLLYGCGVGAGTAGQRFIETLAGYTGADVAASSDYTGAAARGADWVLEAATGRIEAVVPVDALTLGNYTQVLPAAGSLDTTFDGDGIVTTAIGTGPDEAFAIVPQPDGRIVVAGWSFNGVNYDFALVRYNADGSLDATFDGDGKLTTAIGTGHDGAFGIGLQSDGRIVVAGYGWSGTKYDVALARYNTNGSLDTSFDGDGKVTTAIGSSTDGATSLALQPDGRIVVAGWSFNGTDYDFALVRYNTDGSLDTAFDGDGKVTTDFGTGDDEAYGLALQADGKIVVGGRSWNGTDYDFALARYNADGSLDTSFGSDGSLDTGSHPGGTVTGSSLDIAAGIAIQPDGKIVVAGYLFTGGRFEQAVTRYNTDGTLDTTFGMDGTVFFAGPGDILAFSVKLQPDGKIVVAGKGSNGMNDDGVLVRLNSDGSLDTLFAIDGFLTIEVAGADDSLNAVAILSNGNIVAAGGSGGDIAVVQVESAILPSIFISPLSADKPEGDNGTTVFTFIITLVGPLNGETFTVDWTVGPSDTSPSADADDFFGQVFPSGTATVTATTGKVEDIVEVHVTGDLINEIVINHIDLGEHFNIMISNPSGGATITTASADGHIQNDDWDFVGGPGNDTLIGDAHDNLLEGLGGNDTLTGAAGNDSLDGGAGADTAVYSGNRADYAVSGTVPNFTVSGPEGSDTLTSIERFQFADKKLAFDLGLNEAAGNTVRIIGAAFDAPFIIPQFVKIGLNLFDSGESMLEVSALVIGTGLFQSLAGSSSNEAFVNLVFQNVVGVAPTADQRAFFVGMLVGSGGSMTQAELLVVAANHNLNAVNIDLVGLQESGAEFV